MHQAINSVLLTSIKLISFNFEVYDSEKAAKGGSINFGSDSTLMKNDGIDEENIKSLISDIIITAKSSSDEVLFKMEAKYSSSYEIVDKNLVDSLSEEELSDLCLSLIYTTIRDDVMYALSRAGLRQIMFPFHMLK